MIDGIKINIELSDFDLWKESTKIEFCQSVLDTGEIKSKVRNVNGYSQRTFTHRGEYQTYRLTVKEIERLSLAGNQFKNYYLTLEGSLHKNYYTGENYSSFTWDNIQDEISNIENRLTVNPDFAEIVNIEFGVNIPVPFNVFPFLRKNLISHKGKPFNSYKPDRAGFVLGYVCEHSQYSVKIYDKGKQFNLPYPLMRFELRYTKMQPLKDYGINVLTDLKDFNKVKNLINLLSNAWENVLIYDNDINLKSDNISKDERDLLRAGQSPKYWEAVKDSGTRKFNYQRDKFRKLVSKYGTNLHESISVLIKNTWDNLFENCTNLPSVQSPELNKFTVKIKSKNVQSPPANTDREKRICKSCGRDISRQRDSSQFCSAKYVGEQSAHKCRNTDSNQRNNLKTKIKKINGRGVLFDISPFIIVKNKELQSYAFHTGNIRQSRGTA